MKYRFKVKIVLDDEKIREVGEYTPESIRKAICENFEMFDLPRLKTTDGSMVFCDRGRGRDYGALWSVINTLYDGKEWFRAYVIKFTWYNKQTADEDEKFHTEDILSEFRKYDEGN